MRRVSIFAIFLVVVLAGLWLGGETLLARKLSQLAEQDPKLEIGAVTELRDMRQIGVHLADLQVTTPKGALTLPTADLWLSPVHLTTARLTLPDQATLDMGAGPLTLELSDPGASLRLRPLGGMTLGSADVTAGPMKVDGASLADGLHVSAELGRLGHDSPLGAMAAYDLKIDIEGFDPKRIAPEITLPGALQFEGSGRVWLDSAPGPRTLAPETRPALVGLRIDQAELTLGDLGVSINGRLEADAEGRAKGELTLATEDIGPFLQAAASAGLIPEQAVVLAGAVWQKLATRDDATKSGDATPTKAKAKGPRLRLPVTFADGKMHLGPLPLGPAPLFPR